MAVPVDLYVMSDASVPAPIQGVTVSLFDPAASYALAGQTQTDSEGRASFLLPGLDPAKAYEARFYKLGVIFNGVVGVPVLEPTTTPNIFDISGHVVTLAVATDPRLCRCTGRFLDFSNRAMVGGIVRIFTKESGFQIPKVVDGNMIAGEAKTLTVDANGFVVVDLHRGGEYNVTFSGELDAVWSFKVPDAPSANLVELIHPQPTFITWDQATAPSDAVSLQVGFALPIPLTLLFSNGEERTTGLPTWLQAESSDDSIATVRLVDGMAAVTAVSPGVALVLVSCKPDLYPSRMPPPSISVAPLTVTVTPAP